MFGISPNLHRRREFYKSKMPTHGKTLRDVVKAYSRPSYTSRELSQGSNGDTPVWYGFPGIILDRKRHAPEPCNFDGVCGLRCEGAANRLKDHDSYRDAYGYYCDNFASRTVYPLVFRLPKGRGFLRGYYMEDNGELVLVGGIYSDSRDAFNAAHRYAERLAEDEREHDAQFQAECQIEDARAEIKGHRKAALALVRELKAMRGQREAMPALYDAAMSHLKSHLADIRKERKRIEKLTRDPWEAVANY